MKPRIINQSSTYFKYLALSATNPFECLSLKTTAFLIEKQEERVAKRNAKPRIKIEYHGDDSFYGPLLIVRVKVLDCFGFPFYKTYGLECVNNEPKITEHLIKSALKKIHGSSLKLAP